MYVRTYACVRACMYGWMDGWTGFCLRVLSAWLWWTGSPGRAIGSALPSGLRHALVGEFCLACLVRIATAALLLVQRSNAGSRQLVDGSKIVFNLEDDLAAIYKLAATRVVNACWCASASQAES